MTETIQIHKPQPLDDHAVADLFTSARTVSYFSGEPVSDEQLTAIWDLAKWTPTAANTQPLRVLFVNTPEGKERLLRHINDSNKAKVESAGATAVLAIDPEYYEFIPTTFPHAAGLRDTFAANPDVAEASAKISAGLQGGGFIYAVRAVGLAAGPMTGFDAAGVDAEFFGESGWKSFLVVNIGQPGENAHLGRLPRVPEEKATRFV
ncbi:malonic semialdehyde reductase [Nocardioides sp. Kera G14]|uniref:malonic semialdehyde reductase n=1 Tax=Nocardioides sp. Kera G14 TaxID=2884264 RepID=UPI001D1013C0|nr:malonic semialdehyde reductase [Nocardioides sp. Kera G14]UDY22990.1 malonic semialdehyde reductase [Nocardioides sp. Kera G14]